MFEVKPMSVEKTESSAGTDDGRKQQSMGPVRSRGEGLCLIDSQDWVLSPSSPDEPSGISSMLAEETFRYMILSSDRVEQMTKTFSDIDVVTHLLAERDRDLELAARIGQSLLQRNHILQERNDSLEEQLAEALDQVHQLQHELAKKDELLRMVASASEESETDSSCSTPLRHQQPLGAALALSQLEFLQSKLQEVEEENLLLRSEAGHLKKETVTYEEKEQQLVRDCVKELRESNSQMVSLTEELSQKNETLQRQQEEMAQLLTQVVELQHRVKELALEKEELRIHLQASKDAQRQLTAELNELADRNAECVAMLQESQEEIKDLRSKNTPSSALRRHLPYGLCPMDSLAAEIEGTMRRELSVEEEMAFHDQRVSQKRVFQTVRSVKECVERVVASPVPNSALMTTQPFLTAYERTHRDSREGSPPGQPGSPGGSDLVSAVHRLALRRQNFLCERQFFQAEKDQKLQAATGAEPEWEGRGFSPVSSFTNLSEYSVPSSYFKTFLPEKLQIVKPMEGSLTLHHWQQLAKPHLGTILDPHPGVVTKGFRPLPQDEEYRLTDPEEDEEEGGRSRGPWVKTDEEEEEEEGGITFQVKSSSSPLERRERAPPIATPPRASLSPSRTAVPSIPTMTSAPSLTPSPTLTSAPTTSSCYPVESILVPSSSANQPSNQICSTAPPSVLNPGKCQSSTFSTYTVTTCRILHPSDITQVTSSSSCRSSVSENTPSSMRTGPSTPVTPCRLGLADSFPPRRPSPAPRGLAKLLLERGISARAPSSCQPLPTTPPNSPSPGHSPVTFEPGPAPSDSFLASRPAEVFLQDVYGLKLGRTSCPDLPGPAHKHSPKPERAGAHLVDRLRRLGLATVLQGAEPEGARQESAPGGGGLLDVLRRNQSLPAMIGARGLPVVSPSHSAPPPHPTSLALLSPPWGNPGWSSLAQRPLFLSQAMPPSHP